MKWKTAVLLLAAIIVLGGGIYGWHEYHAFNAVPVTRLAAGSYYLEMPPDEYHHYLQIPIDHQDPSLGNFTDFYLLNPEFRAGDNVVFWLCDNQQEAVGLKLSWDEFDANLGGLSYVLIGNRGVYPTLFPEAFNKDGSINYTLAMKLYGSKEQIDDIEAVRQDMQKKGLLPKDGKIMVYGRSGGGVLVQQYLDKYGDHVSRALIEASGGPDLAMDHNATFMKNTYESDPKLARSYFALSQKGGSTASLAFMLFMIGQSGDVDLQRKLVNSMTDNLSLGDKITYLKNWLIPSYNLPFVHLLFSAPRELAVKVRLYELTADDLDNYHPASPQEVCLGYEWLKILLADFITVHDEGLIPITQINLNRLRYSGEAMVWSGTADQVFAVEMGHWISSSYPHSRLAVFDDTHHFQRHQDYYRKFRRAFFTYGLNSSEVQTFFEDPRQLNAQFGLHSLNW
jgi:pimeloyl-ACP methyl ester carboxylesterase